MPLLPKDCIFSFLWCTWVPTSIKKSLTWICNTNSLFLQLPGLKSPVQVWYLEKLFTFISYILAWTVTKRHWLLKQSIGTMAMENEAFNKIWITLIVALFLLIVGPILACKLYKKSITSLHPSYQIVEEEIKTENAQRTKEKCWGLLSCCSKLKNCSKRSCCSKLSCCPTISCCPTVSSCSKPSCVCCGEKESTAPGSHDEVVEEAELNMSYGGKEIKDMAKPDFF